MKNWRIYTGIAVAALAATWAFQNCSPAKYKSSPTTCTGANCSAGVKFMWFPEPWGECVGSQQSRSFKCHDAITGEEVDAAKCPKDQPDSKQDCSAKSYHTYLQDIPSEQNQVDFLLVLDDSGSMVADIKKLGETMGPFAQELSDSGLDWQMCYTTTDVEGFQGLPLVWSGLETCEYCDYLLKDTTPNFAKIFTDTLIVDGGDNNDEQGIAAAIGNLEANKDYYCFRNDAALSVIIISDEDEKSDGKNLGANNNPEAFVTKVKQVFSEEKRFNVNAIVVKDEACRLQQEGEGSPSYIGQQYIDLANLTGGYSGSICANDYTQNLRYFQDRLKHTVSQVTLACPPNPTSIEVITLPKVDGLAHTISGSKVTFNKVIPSAHRLMINYVCL